MSIPIESDDICFGATGYVKKRSEKVVVEKIPRPPRRYRRAFDRATRRHTVSAEEIRDRPICYRSLGHSSCTSNASIQQASFNKSAAKSCRLIKLQRGKTTISLPDLFATSYNPNLNELDGLNPLCFKKNNNNHSQSLLPTDSSNNSVHLLSLTSLTTRKQKPPPSPSQSPSSSPPPSTTFFEKHSNNRNRSNTLPKAVNLFFNSIKDNHSNNNSFQEETGDKNNMKDRTKEKSATTTSGKPKKKRPSIFSFFSRKKRTETTKPHSTLDDNVSHGGGSELNFDDVVVPKETTNAAAANIPTPVRSKKTFHAPLPPSSTTMEENKENNSKESSSSTSMPRKCLSNTSGGPPKFSRQNSTRSSRKSLNNRRKAAAAASQNSKTAKKGGKDETKSNNSYSSDAAPNDPPPPPPPIAPLETCIDDFAIGAPPKINQMSQFTPSNFTVIKSPAAQTHVEFLVKSVEITPFLLETDIDKTGVSKAKKQQKEESSISKEKNKQKMQKQIDDEKKNVEITTDMIFSSLPQQSPQQQKIKSSSSPKQTKSPKKKEEKEEEVKVPETPPPPAIPQSAPPDPIAFATALSFTSSYSPPFSKQPISSSSSSAAAQTVKRLSNFGLAAAKVPPIPVSTFEDLTDSSSESGHSTTTPTTNITMPIYTNTDIKHHLHMEHKKLLNLFEEWEMLRRPRYANNNAATNGDGHLFANIMVKQEAVLRQHAIVTSLYNQLLAPVVSNNSSPSSTIRSKAAPPRHIINSNPPTLSRSFVPPPLFKSRSTFDVNAAENNNIKKQSERNYQIGPFSPKISQTKRYSAGDVLNPMRPRLGSSENSEETYSPPHRYDNNKKYVVEQKPIIRNVPILSASIPKLTNAQIITEPKRNTLSVPPPPQQQQQQQYYANSPPATRREIPINGYHQSVHSPPANSPPMNRRASPPMNKRAVPIMNGNMGRSSPPINNKWPGSMVNGKNIENVEPKKENIEIKKQNFNNTMVQKNPSPLLKSKTMEKSTAQLPPPPSYNSSRINNHQHYYANSPPTNRREIPINGYHNQTAHSPRANSPPPIRREIINTNGYNHHSAAHSPPVKQMSLPEVINKAAKPPTPIQNKKVIVTPKSSPKTSPQGNNNTHGDIMSSISAFPNVTLRSVPKPVEKSFNLGRVLENGERPSTQYREPEQETYSKPFSNGTSSGPPAPPPPHPPPSFSSMPLKKATPKQTSQSNANDSDALRGDMLAEIRKAGGIRFLRSISSQ